MLTSADPLRHVAVISRRNNSPCVTRLILWKSLSLRQNFVAAISRTNRGDKISESSVVAACVHFRQQVAATKYKWTNEGASYGQPCWIRKLVHIPLHMRLLRVHRTDIVSQRLVTSAEGEVKDSRCSGMCQSCHFWQDWASKVCMFSVLFGYLTKWEPN